jgi:hypothetical protein
MKRALAVVLAAISGVLIAGSVGASPSQEDQADAILAGAKAVTGGAAWDQISGWHEQGTIERDGGHIRYETWLDIHRPGMISQVSGGGGRWQTRGFDGRTTWVIDDSNGAAADPSEKAMREARQGDYFSLYGFFFPHRFAAKRAYVGARATAVGTFDVVRVTPEGSGPMDLWIDRKTHQLSAVVDPDPAHPLIAFLGDFKPTDGVLLPYTVMQSGAAAAHVSVRHVVAYDFSPVDPTRFASPAP